MKDYSRKHYTDYRYNDWLLTTPSKAIWNSILSKNAGYGEFSLSKSRKSSLSRAVISYLKQSERKKPYNDRGFMQMEDDWEGPGGGINWPKFPTKRFDQPWSIGPPGDNETPWTVIFDITSSSCWCKEEERPWKISGTHPIYSIQISLSESGTTVNITGGLGTNEVFGTITAGSEEVGDVNFTAYMTTYLGISGSDNYLMPECRDCDPCPEIDDLAAGSNPDTIGQSDSVVLAVVDGRGPFSWSVTGSGFTLDDAETVGRGNNLNSDADACGTATGTVTDDCNDQVTIEVRCTADSEWVFITSGCVMGGAATEGDGQTRIVGGSKQTQNWHGSGGGSCGVGFECREGGGCTEQQECITQDCPAITGDPAAFTWIVGCCTVPCPPPVGAFYCQSVSGTIWQYSEWECS